MFDMKMGVELMTCKQSKASLSLFGEEVKCRSAPTAERAETGFSELEARC